MAYPQARTEILIGAAGVEFLKQKTVLVAGLGGVGGFCAEALARAGIGKLILLDHDVVSPSNINRQLIALHSNIGQEKTALMAARIKDINPDCEIEIWQKFLRVGEAEALLANRKIDFIADCIDSIACKADLICAAQKFNLQIISAMGAGNRLDVSKIKIKKLNQSTHCPLARELRYRLKELGANLHYPVVYSDENPRPTAGHQAITGAEPGIARAVNGTISYMPALFGFFMGGYILQQFINDYESASAA